MARPIVMTPKWPDAVRASRMLRHPACEGSHTHKHSVQLQLVKQKVNPAHLCAALSELMTSMFGHPSCSETEPAMSNVTMPLSAFAVDNKPTELKSAKRFVVVCAMECPKVRSQSREGTRAAVATFFAAAFYWPTVAKLPPVKKRLICCCHPCRSSSSKGAPGLLRLCLKSRCALERGHPISANTLQS